MDEVTAIVDGPGWPEILLSGYSSGGLSEAGTEKED
jgi:hypothetical protein